MGISLFAAMRTTECIRADPQFATAIQEEQGVSPTTNAGKPGPGYKSTLSWWKLELYSEGEYVIDTNDTSDSFFYTWSELSLAPVDWFRFGLVVQRTKLYETEFDIQRGFLAGFSYKTLDITGYVFNPDADRPTVVLAVSLGF